MNDYYPPIFSCRNHISAIEYQGDAIKEQQQAILNKKAQTYEKQMRMKARKSACKSSMIHRRIHSENRRS